MINFVFLNLYGVFLQSIQKVDTPTLAVIISSITATIFVITLILTWRNLRENTKVSYSQLLRGFHEDLTNRLDKNSILKTTEDCHRYANDYLNTVDEIAFLAIQKKIGQIISCIVKNTAYLQILTINCQKLCWITINCEKKNQKIHRKSLKITQI